MENTNCIDAATAAITTGEPGAECTVYPVNLLDIGASLVTGTHTVRRYSTHYACTCPAWRFHIERNVKLRSCEHLVETLGEEYERVRMLLYVRKQRWH